MKKIFSILMIAVLAGLASCSDDTTETSAPAPQTKTFRVDLPAVALSETRTTLDEDTGKLSWEEGDAISLHVVAADGTALQTNCKFTYQNGVFVGEFTAHDNISDWSTYTACEWYAYYPYGANNTADKVVGTLPTKQSITGYTKEFDFMVTDIVTGSYAEQSDLEGKVSLVLPAEGIKLKFQKSKTSIIKLTIPAITDAERESTKIPSGDKITRVSIAASLPDNYYMTGSFEGIKTHAGYDPFAYVNVLTAEKYASWIAASEAEYIDPAVGGEVWFVVNATSDTIPAKYFRITCTTNSGELSQSSTKAIAFPGGGLKKMSLKWNNWSNVVNVSASGSANCYVVKPNRAYRFKTTVRGNGIDTEYKISATETATLLGAFTTEEMNAQSGAKLIWEVANEESTQSAQDSNVINGDPTYKDGFIKFETGLAEGNAVIAVTDAAGNIIWSWHIWSTDDADAIFNATAITSYTKMMDRNLGAGRKAVAKSGKSTAPDYQDRGLFYQWGRKDPFVYDFNGKLNGANKRKGDGSDWVFQPAPTGTEAAALTYSIQHPSTFMGWNAGTKDWYTNTVEISQGNTLWNGGTLSKTNFQNYVSTIDTHKSIFDPCPRGYRMPISGIWGREDEVKTNKVGTWHYYGTNTDIGWLSDVTTNEEVNGSYFIESAGEYAFYPSVSALMLGYTAFQGDNNVILRYWTGSMRTPDDGVNSGDNNSYYGGTVWIKSDKSQPFNFAPKGDCRPVRCVQIDYFTDQIYRQ